MKYIKKEEVEKGIWLGKGHCGKVFREVANLEIGQILFIEPSDWDKSYPPSQTVRYIEKKYNRKYFVLRKPARQGWAVERIS